MADCGLSLTSGKSSARRGSGFQQLAQPISATDSG
jgi:hypothetical protein